MLTDAAQRMGYRVAVLDPDPQSAAGAVADRWIRGDCRDEAALAELGASCAGAFSLVDDEPPALARFAVRCPLVPHPAVAALCRDPGRWPELVDRCGVDVARPGDDLTQRREIAVIVARRGPADLASYPAVENRCGRGALETSIAPARISRDLAARAAAVAERITEQLDLVGVLCVEFALLPRDGLAVRALVPQPPACGYYTIDACPTSQFEQQVRILAGMPLGPIEQHSPAVVVMLPGEPRHAPDQAALERRFGVTLHLHGATGHCTVLAAHIETALDAARAIRAELVPT
jgi:5-(carboxyamino)imidazole ribonucleotide synthase